MTEFNHIYQEILNIMMPILCLFYFCKFLFVLSSNGTDVKSRNIEYMDIKTIVIDIVMLIIKLFVGVIWNVWTYQASQLSIVHRMSEQESSFILFSIISISILNAALVVTVIASLWKVIIDVVIRMKQKKNTVQNNLIKAIYFGNVDDIVYYYKLINQQNPLFNRPILIERNSGAELLLTQNYWLMIISALMKTDEIEEAKTLSENIRGQRVVKHYSPVKRFKRKFNGKS